MSVSSDGTKALVWNDYQVYEVQISKPGIAQEGPTVVKLFSDDGGVDSESSVDSNNSLFQFTSSNQILRLMDGADAKTLTILKENGKSDLTDQPPLLENCVHSVAPDGSKALIWKIKSLLFVDIND